MLWWFAETTLIAGLLALVAMLAPRVFKLGPAARHLLWLLVIIKLVTPPVVRKAWPLGSLIPRGTQEASADVEVPAPAVVFDDIRAPIEIQESLPPIEVNTVVFSEPEAYMATVEAKAQAAVEPAVARPARQWPPIPIDRVLLGAWLAISVLWGLSQWVRIARFRRRLNEAKPAPDWLLDETDQVAADLGVRLPEVVVLNSLDVPALWCLGRPVLMLPKRLVTSEGPERWRGILAHELAHLRRRDHWVARLELVASLIWWWNPLYWFARSRVDAEAELACDAWVIAVLPEDRFRYAETLLEVCASLSRSKVPLPTLGIGGAGRFFERRLSMILHEKVPYRLSISNVLGVGLLGLLAAPAWSIADPPETTEVKVETRVEASDAKPAQVTTSEETFIVFVDDEDKKDNDKDKAKVVPDRKPRVRFRRDVRPGKAPSIGIDIDLSGLEELLGPDSEFMESLNHLTSEIEAQLGSGSELEKRVKELNEGINKELKEKLGPGSEFEKKLREKLGPGSDFEKELKTKLGPHLEFKFHMRKHSDEAAESKEAHEDRELSEAKRAEDKAQAELEKQQRKFEKDQKRLEEDQKKFAEDRKKLEEHQRGLFEKQAKIKRDAAEKVRAKAIEGQKARAREVQAKQRQARIQAIEARLKELAEELKNLKNEGPEEEEEGPQDF